MSALPTQPQPQSDVISVPAIALAIDDPDPTDLCSCTATSLRSLAGEIIVLQVAGEVDSFTCPLLRAALTDGLARRPGYVIVDLSRLTFCDARGLAQLVLAGVTATKNGTGYAISGCPTHLSRIWSTIWGTDVPTRYRSVAAAIAGIWASQTPKQR